MKVLAVFVMACVAFGLYTQTDANVKSDRIATEHPAKVGESFGEQVRIARIKKGLTTLELAKKAGISRSDLEQLERGQLILSREMKQQITAALQVQMDTTVR